MDCSVRRNWDEIEESLFPIFLRFLSGAVGPAFVIDTKPSKLNFDWFIVCGSRPINSVGTKYKDFCKGA